MTRALIAVGAALALCFAGAGLLVYLSREEERVAVDSGLAERISRELTESAASGAPVDLAELAPFAWDRVIVVPRRTPDAEISRRLGSPFEGHLPYDAESPALFVFADGSRLARFADYRGARPFEGLPAELPRDRALLRVRAGAVRPG